MSDVAEMIRRYGRLVLETVGARGLIFVGDASAAMNLLRRGVGNVIREAPRRSRGALAQSIAVTRRTVEQWMAFAREYEASEEEDDSLGANSLAARVFFSAGMFLQDAEEEYRSLGAIADHVKEVLRDRVSTEEVRRLLEAYVALSILEHHPEDREKYRLAAPVQFWTGATEEHMEKVLSILLPTAFELGYQAFVGTRGALARVVYYRIPEERRDEFVHKVIEEMRRVKERLDEYEKELQQQSPGGAVVYMRDIHLAGYTSKEPRMMGPTGRKERK